MRERLSLGSDIDYSGFRIGFGKTFRLRSNQIQIEALKGVDQHTVRGLLRTSDRFKGLSAEMQSSLLASAAQDSGCAQLAKTPECLSNFGLKEAIRAVLPNLMDS